MSPIKRKICYVASTTLLLSALEYLIPKPLPFLKLGLANLPLLVVLDSFGWKDFLLLSLLKICGSSIVSGTLFSYVFILVFLGGLASSVVMKGASSLMRSRISTIGCSSLGALASNLVQLWAASVFVYGPSIWVAAPLLLTVGLCASVILGALAGAYKRRGRLLACERASGEAAAWETSSHPVPFLLLSITVVLVAIERKPLPLLLAMAVLFATQKASGRKILLGPSLILFFSLLVLSLFEPNGKVLCTLGSLAVTKGALLDATVRGLRLVTLVACSQAMVTVMPHVPGTFFSMLSLTLGYFSSFRIRKRSGTFVQWIDDCLETALTGPPKAQKQPAVRLMIVFSFLSIVFLIIF